MDKTRQLTKEFMFNDIIGLLELAHETQDTQLNLNFREIYFLTLSRSHGTRKFTYHLESCSLPDSPVI